MPSRRALLAGVTGIVTMTAGCTGGGDLLARCSSRGTGSDSEHLQRVAPIRGDEHIALGVLVSETAVTDDRYHAIRIEDGSEDLVASIPLMDNRNMSGLDPSDFSVFTSATGELYAEPLGPPPVHGAYTVSLVSSAGERLASARKRFNCYAEDGTLS
jgi:hypothetical protein